MPRETVLSAYACPRCKAGPNGERREDRGVACSCEGMTEGVGDAGDRDHGMRADNRCRTRCARCGWQGYLPHDPVILPPWQGMAIAQGWTPPED